MRPSFFQKLTWALSGTPYCEEHGTDHIYAVDNLYYCVKCSSGRAQKVVQTNPFNFGVRTPEKFSTALGASKSLENPFAYELTSFR